MDLQLDVNFGVQVSAWFYQLFLLEFFKTGDKAFAVFAFTAYGIPMIYSGQETGLDKRLAFFEKDSIDWTDDKAYTPFYQKLVKLRKDNPALWSGHYGGIPHKIETGNSAVLAYSRTKDDNKAIVIINMSDKDQAIQLDSQVSSVKGTDYMTGKDVNLGEINSLQPYQYIVLTL